MGTTLGENGFRNTFFSSFFIIFFGFFFFGEVSSLLLFSQYEMYFAVKSTQSQYSHMHRLQNSELCLVGSKLCQINKVFKSSWTFFQPDTTSGWSHLHMFDCFPNTKYWFCFIHKQPLSTLITITWLFFFFFFVFTALKNRICSKMSENLHERFPPYGTVQSGCSLTFPLPWDHLLIWIFLYMHWC